MNSTTYSSVGKIAPLEFTGDDPRAYIIIGCIMGMLLLVLCCALFIACMRSEWCDCMISRRHRIAVIVPEPVEVIVVPNDGKGV